MSDRTNPIHRYLNHIEVELAFNDSDQDAIDVVRDAYVNLFPDDTAATGWNLSDALDVLGDDYPSDRYDSADVQASIGHVRALARRVQWDDFSESAR